MNIGLFFGSFNPIHTGHLIVASHILNVTNLEKIWFVVSPQNPLKSSNTLLNEYDRLHLVQLAIQDDDRLRSSDIEFNLPKPSFTVHTLTYLKEKYPTYKFSIIMGSDSFSNLGNWKNPEVILNNFAIIIYKRPGFEIIQDIEANIHVVNAPLLEISATHIRQTIATQKSIKYLVPEIVREEIEKSGYYKLRQIK